MLTKLYLRLAAFFFRKASRRAVKRFPDTVAAVWEDSHPGMVALLTRDEIYIVLAALNGYHGVAVKKGGD